MSQRDSATKFQILLFDNQEKDSALIKEWLQEIGEITTVSNKKLFTSALKKKNWQLIIVGMQFDEVENQSIIKQTMGLDKTTSILLLVTKDNNEFTFKEEFPRNFIMLYKPLEKTLFLDNLFKLTAPLNRRHRIDRRRYKQKNVLFIGAHPDDVEIGCGGCMSAHHARGDSINILTLSCGEFGGHYATRREEAKKSANILHANLIIKDLTDTQIHHVHTIHAINEAVEEIKPTHVYTHSIHDAHQDHRNVYRASVVACRNVPNLYCYQSPSSTIFFQPNLFIEITDFIDQKLEVLAAYQSQISKRPYLQEDMIRATARYWGRYSNYGLAEPMEIIRQTEELPG